MVQWFLVVHVGGRVFKFNLEVSKEPSFCHPLFYCLFRCRCHRPTALCLIFLQGTPHCQHSIYTGLGFPGRLRHVPADLLTMKQSSFSDCPTYVVVNEQIPKQIAGTDFRVFGLRTTTCILYF